MVGRVRGTVITKNRVRTETPHYVLSQKTHTVKNDKVLRQQQTRAHRGSNDRTEQKVTNNRKLITTPLTGIKNAQISPRRISVGFFQN